MSQHSKRVQDKSRPRNHDARNLLAAALALALATVGGSTQAATQLVSNCSDHDPGSMRAAIAAAMSGDVVDATGLTCSTISLSTGALAVTVNSLTVKGAGPDRLTVTNGAKYGRVFRHEGNVALNLQGMTITGGVVSPNGIESGTKGGCIYSNGAVNLGNVSDPNDAASGVVVSDCTAISTHYQVSAAGGGIFARRGIGLMHSVVSHAHVIARDQATQAYGGGISQAGGSLLMRNSEVRECSADGAQGIAGGVDADYSNAVTISHSTIAGNTASATAGGAFLTVFDNTGVIRIDNSTISGNSASRFAGAFVNVSLNGQNGVIRIFASTITDNHATTTDLQFPAGASLKGAVELQSTIVSGNFTATYPVDLAFASSASSTGADNLLGIVRALPAGIGYTSVMDPRLGPLSNRGGFTRIHLPHANSPAINAGNNSSGSTTDQRGPGFPRVIGSAPDIGAAEFDPDRIFNNGFD